MDRCGWAESSKTALSDCGWLLPQTVSGVDFYVMCMDGNPWHSNNWTPWVANTFHTGKATCQSMVAPDVFHRDRYMRDIQLGLHVGPLTTGAGAISDSVGLRSDPLPLDGLPHLASVGEVAPGITATWNANGGWYPLEDFLRRQGGAGLEEEGEGEGAIGMYIN